ncbi:DUF5685 family protein [Gordonia sp. HY442]|uniref:DUF5685 family protein n=1 Tax=Gordonia zhenghanii TaxID=2911516 RepID=UPI001F3FCBAE|nr:DUF5685 family protein [Gordonia zhenghanii]MCF8606559.1 DUF5685 family protein [Gordonia zhenghanii]
MFGILQPCRHVLDDDLHDEWRAHMCGLCLSLRDGHGQATRLTTNTDAVMVSVLTAAQREPSAATRTAGPCAFRSMRRADVVTSTEPGVRLATAASLTLAAAKADDVVAEQRLALAPAAPARGRAARSTGRALHRKAARTGDVLDVTTVLTALDRQADLESSSNDLDALTGPTARACATVFSASADLADVPDNRHALADIGSEYGRLAHLLDAIDDRSDDDADGAFNPLTATGTSDDEAIDRTQLSADRIAERYLDLTLHDDRLLKALLIDGVAQAVRRRRRAGERRQIAAIGAGLNNWPPHPPADWPPHAPYPPPFPPNRSWYQRILPFTGVTFCGPALCADHWNHCSDKYKKPLADGGDCCDCCDCCDCP